MLRMIVCVPASSLIELTRLDDLLRIESGGRLVEDEHLGIVQNRLREPDALPVALRELSAVAVRHVVDTRPAHRLFDAALPLARRHPFVLMRATNSRYSRTVISG